jgi:chemotaxis protein methyltransferase CheR
MRSSRCHDAAAYCDLLQQSDQELEQLKKNLTIHVSQFFRNPLMFEKLQTTVLPRLFKEADARRKPLRFWSLGCASGEEAYSLGIILREFFARELLHTAVEIRGFDIDAGIIQAAVQAEYIEDRLKDLPVPLRELYFVPKGARLQLSADVRNMVTFHQQNIKDIALLEPCDLALCRNTLIYFTRSEQEKILQDIAHKLPPGGILVLGKSETVTGGVRSLFTTVCPIERIYRKL